MTTNNFRVAGFVTGLAIKAPVHTASLVNIPTPTGVGGNINGYIVSKGDRVLLTAQTDPIDNGIYSVQESAWFRDGDADGNRDFVGGTIVPVWTAAQTSIVLWRLGGDPDPKTIGVDALTFTVYYDSAAILPEVDTLQSVTTRGNTTDAGIISDADIIVQNGNILRVQDSDADETQIYWAADQFLITPGIGGKSLNIAIFDYALLQSARVSGPVFFLEQASADADLTSYGQVWCNSVPNPNELMFTNEDGDDINLTTELWDNGTRQILSNSLGAAVRVALFIGDDDNGFGAGFGSLYIADRATPGADFTGQGQFWVRSTDDAPMYTSEAGVDSVLNAPASVAGAKAFGSVNHSINTASVTPVILNAEAYDTATIHDNAVNNTRLTVPAGVTRIRLTGYVKWAANGSAMRQLAIRKNGAGGTIDDDMAGYEPSVYKSAAGASAEEVGVNIDSGIIRAVATDYFELMVEQTSGVSLNLLAGDHWFQMEIIE